jgi:acetolactate synthase-1/2/3 large subunit
LGSSLNVLRTKKAALFVGGDAVTAERLALAQRVAHATGARLIMETFPAIMDRGTGVVSPERLIYLSEFAIAQLQDLEALILIGSTQPVGFFAYPDVKSQLTSDGCDVIELAPPGCDTSATLRALVEGLEAPVIVSPNGEGPGVPHGELTTQSLAAAVAATIPEGLIISDESNTGGNASLRSVAVFPAPPTDDPDRWVDWLRTAQRRGRGGGQWTTRAGARSRRINDVHPPSALDHGARKPGCHRGGTVNRSYAILNLERQRVGAVTDGLTSQRMLELDNPTIDLCALASAQGVPSTRVATADELVTALERSYATPGPMFIEAVLPKGLT